MKKEPKIKIFVAHHKPWYIYEDDVYVPIQVWKKNAKIDLWILWDDTWDNISEKNDNYAELTARYWVWKNYDLGNVDYVWFCHYRRYLWYNFKRNILKFRNNFDKNKSIYMNLISIIKYVLWWEIDANFDKNKISECSKSSKFFINQKKCDLFLSKSWFLAYHKPLYHLWLIDNKLRELTYNIIIDKNANYIKTIKWVQNTRFWHWCNLWIMKTDLFLEYNEWLFGVLIELEREIKDKHLKDVYLKETMTAGTRFLWCLGERLFNLRIAKKEEEWLKISTDASIVFFKNI